MLPNIRFYDRECFTGARSSHYPCASERIDDVDPAMAEFALIVEAHRYVYGIRITDTLCGLLETLVLQVESVFEHAASEVLGYIVKCYLS